MKTIGLFLMIVVLAGGAAFAAEMTAEEWYQYQSEVTAMFLELSEQVARGEATPIKCATPIIYDLLESRPANVLYKPAWTDREDTMSFTYASDHFYLHFTNNGPNAIYEYDEQTLEPGVPDYIVHAARILDSVWNHTVGDLGFPAPLSDGYYNGGGNGLMDVYFIDVAAYGATVRDSIQVTLPLTATAYIFLENDYQNFPGYENNRLDALRVAAAHEFSHTIHFSLDLQELDGPLDDPSPAWMEMSATFMEEEHYPAVNDYLNYLIFFFDVPQWSIRTGTFKTSPTINYWRNLHMYGSVVFPIFLAKKFGSQIIRDIWIGCGTEAGGNWVPSTDAAIRAASNDTLDLQDMYQEFALWTFFTRQRNRPGFFPDGVQYDSVNLAARVTSYPATVAVSDSAQPDNLGANFVVLDYVSGLTSGLAVAFSPDESQPWGITVAKYHNIATLPISVTHIKNDTLSGAILIPDASVYDKVVLIPEVLGGEAQRVDYTMTVTPIGEGVVQPNGGEVLYVGATYEIRWFFDAPGVDSVLIELSTNNGQSWNQIAITANDMVYEWTVPASLSDSCLIQVTGYPAMDPTDMSNDVFGIRSASGNFVYEPFPNPAWVEKYDEMYFKAEYLITPMNPSGEMTVTIVTMAGERIRELSKTDDIGAVVIPWDFTNEAGETVAAGPYIAVIKFEGETTVKKFVVLR